MTEMAGSCTTAHGQCDVYVTAETSYDEGDHVLLVDLAAFVRETGPHGESEPPTPDWLPRPETVKEHVPLTEATEQAREIFHSWANKVRRISAQRTLQTS